MTKKAGFWHFVRYNPLSLFEYWIKHIQKPTPEFWLMMAWNSPSFEAWLSSESEDTFD